MANRRKILKIDQKDLWYFVGLMATDGCLSSDGRHLNLTSKDVKFLDQIKRALGLDNRVVVKNKGKTNEAYALDFSNRDLYEFFLKIGLTPSKSKTLGRLDVPSEHYGGFLRGVIDGDGSLVTWKNCTNGNQQWSLRIYSASENFIYWIREEIEKRLSRAGKIYQERGLFTLKYGKMAAKSILELCYANASLRLERKARLAEEVCRSTELSPRWRNSRRCGLKSR